MKIRRHGRSPLPSPPAERWKIGELQLREREVAAAEKTTKSQRWVLIAQVLSVIVALVATVIAAVAARQSNEAAQSAAQASELQNAESQLTPDISSLEEGNGAVRATRILLVGNEVTRIISFQLSANQARDAYSDYTTTLQAVVLYIHTNDTPASTAIPFGPGHGAPPPSWAPIDLRFAVDEVVQLLQLKRQVNALSPLIPAVDLSNDELYGLDLAGVNLSWVNAFMTGIDLRGALLVDADLSSRDDLADSHLQCADMIGANLQGADLADANLSGADLADADLQGANLAGADLRGAYVKGAVGLPPGLVTGAAQPLSLASCLANKKYGDPAFSV